MSRRKRRQSRRLLTIDLGYQGRDPRVGDYIEVTPKTTGIIRHVKWSYTECTFTVYVSLS